MEEVDIAAAHEARELDEVLERLRQRFPGVSEERVRSVVTEAHAGFAGHPIRDFVPVFVERVARDALSRDTPAAPGNG